MKISLIVFIYIVSNTFCNSLDKEKLDFEKEKLEFEKSKLEFEKQKTNSCCCCKTESKTLPKEEISSPELYIPPKESKDCDSLDKFIEGDIWSLSIDGNWFFPPYSLKKGIICKEDKKEFFYKQFSNTESYVAEKQVPSTKKSSCINNVLFYGKNPLYQLMIDKSSPIKINSDEKKRIIEKLIEYNNEEKGRSFFYECKPTDKNKKWDSCTCVLYASYPKGEKGVQNLIQK